MAPVAVWVMGDEDGVPLRQALPPAVKATEGVHGESDGQRAYAVDAAQYLALPFFPLLLVREGDLRALVLPVNEALLHAVEVHQHVSESRRRSHRRLRDLVEEPAV